MTSTGGGVTSCLIAGALAVLGDATEGHAENVFLAYEELAPPSGAGAREPNLFTAADGRVYLTWLEPLDAERFLLRFASSTDDGWSGARTIAGSEDLFVNWADFPSIVAFADGRLAAHWLRRNGERSYTYDVVVATSDDGGASWSEPIVPHRDRTPTQHGFASLVPLAGGDLAIIWLDGRDYRSGEAFAAAEESSSDVMALRQATLAADGTLSEERVLDERTCTCCQTSATAGPDAIIVAYRDRTAEEIRDISVLRLALESSTPAVTRVAADGWRIAGCPVNGPALDADGPRVAIAWFTAADGVARVQVAFSSDGGRSFGPPTRVDQDDPLGRVDVVLLADGSAVVSWLAYGRGGEELLIRRVGSEGELDPAAVLAVTPEGRTSGFPRMVRAGDRLYLAWTQASGSDPDDSGLMVRTGVIRLGIR